MVDHFIAIGRISEGRALIRYAVDAVTVARKKCGLPGFECVER